MGAAGALVVGVIGAVGGGMLRDVILNLPLSLLHVGTLYAVAAGAGAGVLIVLVAFGTSTLTAGLVCAVSDRRRASGRSPLRLDLSGPASSAGSPRDDGRLLRPTYSDGPRHAANVASASCTSRVCASSPGSRAPFLSRCPAVAMGGAPRPSLVDRRLLIQPPIAVLTR
ncbi:TRIC cation channel family protein [Actinocrispum sp. NPDC049592]|uniref:TRIC cation channel family protein n=1 Tax=Actinocrispum sp. NPDC049592 TaxID=3154835 RepID=UPI00343A850A